MKLEIKLFFEDQVLTLLNDKSFILQWNELAAHNDKVTLIQEPPFVTTWYHHYSNNYKPILILGFDTKFSLVGLLPLAFSLRGQYLTHAGDGQAEYHGWICKNDCEQDFLVQALIAIKKNFKLRKWQWRPLPPGSKIDCFYSSELKREKVFVSITVEDSPLLDLNDVNKIERIRKNKSTQNQLNRYKKRGGFYLERITSREKAEKLFKILSVQCDIRQMASHRATPFADGNKTKFFLDRLSYKENSHFTVLWSDSTPVAFHFGPCDSKTVFNGLSSYNPLEEKNSPGRIHLIKLIELLREEGFKYFDLTPGGDPYKHRYCSFYQKIYTISIYFFRRDKIIGDFIFSLKAILKKLMISLDMDPYDVKYKLNNALALMKKISRVSPLVNIRKFYSIVYEKNLYFVCKLISDNEAQKIDPGIVINNYSDLLLYSESNPWITKTDLFRTVFKHFLSDDILYTIVINGLLAQYGWIAKVGKNQRLRKIEKELISFGCNCSYILYDFYTEPGFSSQELFAKTIVQMLDNCRKNDTTEICIWLPGNIPPIESLVEKTGFRVFRKFQRIKILWFVFFKEFV